MTDIIKKYETAMWKAAQNQDADAFLALVEPDAVMVCGGYRCTGLEYSGIIKEFDIASFAMSDFEIVCRTAETCQVHYRIETRVSREENKDLEGVFHITTTWKRSGDGWKAVFNMDSRVMPF